MILFYLYCEKIKQKTISTKNRENITTQENIFSYYGYTLVSWYDNQQKCLQLPKRRLTAPDSYRPT